MKLDNKIVAERIRLFRKEKKYSQQYVADIIGVNVRTYQLWENGAEVSLSGLYVMSNLFGVSMDVLSGRIPDIDIAGMTSSIDESITEILDALQYLYEANMTLYKAFDKKESRRMHDTVSFCPRCGELHIDDGDTFDICLAKSEPFKGLMQVPRYLTYEEIKSLELTDEEKSIPHEGRGKEYSS